jgi:predicted short-subunit dehydrogenase-like oxidoreductase (DUF2520 family)
MLDRISIVGSGNMALALAKAFSRIGRKPLQIIARENSATFSLFRDLNIPFAFSDTQIEPADLFIIAVSDDSIEQVSNRFSRFDALVVHTSGCVQAEALQANKRYGVFYPMQSVSLGHETDFLEVPFFIQTNQLFDEEKLRKTAALISSKVIDSTNEMRLLMHVAAVFVSNFSNAVYTIACDFLKEKKLNFDLLKPLIVETAAKAIEINPVEAQTGPARRNDLYTIERHQKILEQYPDKKAVYDLLTKYIQSKYENL